MPFAVDNLGRIAFTTDPFEQINQHVMLLIGTHLNERFMLPNYGLDTAGYVFAMLDDATIQRVQIDVERVLSDWEPLVLLRQVTVLPNRDEGSLTVSVDYSLQGAAAAAGDTSVHTATVKVGGSVVTSRG